ncbi:MAG: hypothetical protein JRG91_09905 [Deltaproteobacteria bacterium]|nr:hypothetical protein [Deltaproteobacteria bacterium]
MATRLEKLFWSVLCGAAIGIMGCEKNEPREDGMADAYGPPVDGSVEDLWDDAEDVPSPEPLYGPMVDP